MEPSATNPADGPLTPELRQELALAQGRAKRVRRAARVAGFNGWTTGVVAAIFAPWAVFSLAGCLITGGLAVVAFNEFWGRRRLLRYDPSSADLLGWNQIGLFTLIAAYCLWTLFTGGDSLADELKRAPGIVEALGSGADFDGLYRELLVAIYGAIIALSAVVQGLSAWYYFSRGKHIAAYLRDTPAWVQAVERMTVAA